MHLLPLQDKEPWWKGYFIRVIWNAFDESDLKSLHNKLFPYYSMYDHCGLYFWLPTAHSSHWSNGVTQCYIESKSFTLRTLWTHPMPEAFQKVNSGLYREEEASHFPRLRLTIDTLPKSLPHVNQGSWVTAPEICTWSRLVRIATPSKASDHRAVGVVRAIVLE